MTIEELYKIFCAIGDGNGDKELNYHELFVASTNLVTQLSFSDISELRLFINSKTVNEIYYMPYWLKVLILKLISAQCPNDKEVIKFFINQLEWFGSEHEEYIDKLKSQLSKP